MSAAILSFTRRRDRVDDLADRISALALEKLARKQLGLPPLPRCRESLLSMETDRMADLLADRAERKHASGAVKPECRARLEAIKSRLLGLASNPQVVRFPRSRIVRTKKAQREIQRAYRHFGADLDPGERFRRSELAAQFAADFSARSSL